MAKQTSNTSNTGWDPVLIIAQIISLQALHYLTLALLVSPLLSLFANPGALEYEGGAANVGMIMDWRQMAGKPTTGASLADTWKSLHSVWSGGHQVLSGDSNGSGSSSQQGSAGGGTWSGQMDPRRGWIIAICWLATCGADITYLYHLIRRPRLILDFTLTLLFNHLVLTTYYSSALPSSIFFWVVMAIGAAGTVIVAEQICVKREMEEGLKVSVGSGTGGGAGEEGDEIEMGGLLRHD